MVYKKNYLVPGIYVEPFLLTIFGPIIYLVLTMVPRNSKHQPRYHFLGETPTARAGKLFFERRRCGELFPKRAKRCFP